MKKVLAAMLFAMLVFVASSVSWGVTWEGVTWEGVTWEGDGALTWE
jgi:hypothetical protein